jgi:hypothetical protein
MMANLSSNPWADQATRGAAYSLKAQSVPSSGYRTTVTAAVTIPFYSSLRLDESHRGGSRTYLLAAIMMASAPVLRRLGVAASRARSFHTSPRAFVNVGDTLPGIELVEKSPGNKVNLKDEIKGKALIIGVPAAFST